MSEIEAEPSRAFTKARIKPTLQVVAAEAPDGKEQRTAPRFTLLIRTAKLIADGNEFLCVVRDASPLGIRVKVFHAMPQFEQGEIELPNGKRFAIAKVWERDDLIGFRFPEPIDLEGLLRDAPADYPKREISLNCLLPATLYAHFGSCAVTFRDISQQGARIESPVPLANNERVRLESYFLPAIDAKVCWHRDQSYGLMFDHRFDYRELARICGEASAQICATN